MAMLSVLIFNFKNSFKEQEYVAFILQIQCISTKKWS